MSDHGRARGAGAAAVIALVVGLCAATEATAGGRPPNTIIDSGPSGPTNDPSPTFAFHSDDAGATFQCKVDAGTFSSCTSPNTLSHLDDGTYTFTVRAQNSAGVDPTPASSTFTVSTASVSMSPSFKYLIVTAAAGARDNFRISKPSARKVRVTDQPSGVFTGSGIHVGQNCTLVDDYTANCIASWPTVDVSSGDRIDKVSNPTVLESSLMGGNGGDVLIGGLSNDTVIGGPGSDVMKGMNGNDSLFGSDGVDDKIINCDGAGNPGTTDSADLDTLPDDSPASGCESVTRH